MMKFELPYGSRAPRERRLAAFAEKIKELSENIGFKISSRGWCYILEGKNLVNKTQFDLCQKLINECRKKGYLPIDFVAEEQARQFSHVERIDSDTPHDFVRRRIGYMKRIPYWYDLSFWEGQKYYIQILVEKVDLVTLFSDICEEYHIPIATSKGWSSILQRAELIKRFSEAEERGMIPVLLYCGDFDPAGTLISEKIKKNLNDLSRGTGWRADNLIVDRFGLNFDFIEKAGLSWIPNLATGSGGELARVVNGKIVQGTTKNGRPHKDFLLDYVQDYLKKYGVRKCEANAIVVEPELGQDLCKDAVVKYLGDDSLEKFEERESEKERELQGIVDRIDLDDHIEKITDLIDEDEEEHGGDDNE